MDGNYNGVHIVSRSRKSRTASHRRGGAGILIFVLLLLTAGICALVVLLPRFDGKTERAAFAGRSFYMLCTGETDEYDTAQLLAKDTSDRGGAGYVFNDGKYKIVASAYAREADAKLLSGVNTDSTYFEISFPKSENDGDGAALAFFADEWFEKVSAAASDLERGAVTEAAAEFAVSSVSQKLASLADKCESGILSRALQTASEPLSGSRSVLSKIRYVQARTLSAVYFSFVGLR